MHQSNMQQPYMGGQAQPQQLTMPSFPIYAPQQMSPQPLFGQLGTHAQLYGDHSIIYGDPQQFQQYEQQPGQQLLMGGQGGMPPGGMPPGGFPR